MLHATTANLNPSSGTKLPQHRQFGTFNEIIAPRLEELRDDLIKECERIAGRRELPLKMEIENSRKQNEVLRRKLASAPASGGFGRTESEFGLEPLARSEADLADDIVIPQENAENRSTLQARSLPALRLDSDIDGFPYSKDDNYDISRFETSDVDCTVVCIDGLASIRSGEIAAETLFRVANGEDLEVEDDSAVLPDATDFNLWPEWAHTTPPRVVKPMVVIGPSDKHADSAWVRGRSFLDAYRIDESKCTVLPNSCLALTWDFFGIPILVYDLVTLPLQVFWTHQGDGARIAFWVVILYWTIDIFLRLFVIGFLTPTGKIQRKRAVIMRNYAKGSFLFDMLMVVPDWISMCFEVPRRFAFFRVFRSVRFIRVLRVSKLRQTARIIQDLIDSEYFSIYLNVFWNVLVISGCCHYLACLWYWIGNYSEDEGYNTWINRYMKEEYTWEYAYLTSVHWALCQFTPGSMKVQPNDYNVPERLFAVVVLLWGMVFFSLFVSSITQERMRMRALTKKMDRDNWMLRRYMRQHGVSREFSMRAVQYVDAFVAPMLMRVQRKDVALLDCLSHPLQVELQAEIYFQTLLANPFFANLQDKSSHMAATLLSHVVIEIALAKYDLLFEVGQVSHEMFFVSTGVVAYLKADEHQAVSCVNSREWCCEQIIWVPWVHKGTSRAVGESHLLAVDSAKFRTAVLEYRERDYVRNCARAYLEDLKNCASHGIEVDDLIHLDEHDFEYVKSFSAEIEANQSVSSLNV